MSDTNTPQSILRERVKAAAAVMKTNDAAVFAALSQLGIDKDEDDALELLEADTTDERMAEPWFVNADCANIKAARFRAGWAILKGRSRPSQGAQPGDSTAEIIKTLRSVKQYKDLDLLEAYGPECSSDVLDELRRRSNDRPFLVYEGEVLDVQKSLEMLRIARRQQTNDVHAFYQDGKSVPTRLLRVGQFPTIWLEESPIHPEIILVDGYCSNCNNTWSGVSLEDRTIVRVAVDVDGVDVSSNAKIHELITKVRSDGAKFLLDVPAVRMRFDELSDIGRLPILRRRSSSGSGEIKDPLFVRHRAY